MPGTILNVNDSFSSKFEYSDHHFNNGQVARYSDHQSNYSLVFRCGVLFYLVFRYHSVKRPFDDRTRAHDLNVRLACNSYPHCSIQ